MIDVRGEAYLFNLSLMALTFAAVSVLVMLVRQSMGGKLSNFDVHLATSYVSRGFAVGVAAILPSLIAGFDLPEKLFWPVTSGFAAVIFGVVMAVTQRQRRQITKGSLPPFLIFAVGIQWVAALLLLVNAAVPALQGVNLYRAALTISLAMVMWSFVRRINSLVGDRPGEDWDPKRG